MTILELFWNTTEIVTLKYWLCIDIVLFLVLFQFQNFWAISIIIIIIVYSGMCTLVMFNITFHRTGSIPGDMEISSTLVVGYVIFFMKSTAKMTCCFCNIYTQLLTELLKPSYSYIQMSSYLLFYFYSKFYVPQFGSINSSLWGLLHLLIFPQLLV